MSFVYRICIILVLFLAYTMAKYGMSMCVLGMHEELRSDGIAVNALWPRTAIWTAAMDMLSAGMLNWVYAIY